MVAVDYQPPWDELVTRLKSAHEVDLVPALARLLLAAVRQAGSSGAAADTPACVIPVPLRPARLRARGYNQAALLAQPVACACGLPVLGQALVRVRDTRTQHGLDRAARLRNLRLAFEVPAAMRPMVSGQRIALVDDVMTTGATLEAAALALKCAGAAHVQAWVLARTPAPDL